MLTLPTNKHKIVFIILAIVSLTLVIYLLMPKLTFGKEQLLYSVSSLSGFVERMPLLSYLIAFLFYIAICSVPFPFISIITLAVGYLFGFINGLLLVSFGSALGGLILFSISRRFLKKELVQRICMRFPKIQPMLNSNDLFVAISMRLIPGMPFFLPSIALSMTKLSAIKFYISTQAGLLIILGVFINAGATLSDINNAGGNILSAKLIISLLLLSLLPILLKTILKYKNSKHFD